MANTDLSGLSNITPFSLDSGNITNSGSVFRDMIDTSNRLAGALWYHSAILVIFLALVYILYDRQGDFLYDGSRSVMISSGICLFLAISLTLSTWVTSIYPIFWFTSLFFISTIIVMKRKDSNM